MAARMAAALAAQRAGDAAEAEAGYRGILADAPSHAPATHFLGLLLCQRREFAAGVPRPVRLQCPSYTSASGMSSTISDARFSVATAPKNRSKPANSAVCQTSPVRM